DAARTPLLDSFLVVCRGAHPDRPSFPTRRSSDLEFTQAVRAEPGCLWFDWSRSVADPNEYVLVEAYRDDDAAAAHVNADHFAKRSEEHTSELQSRFELVCRLRLDKKDLHQRGARG